MKIQILTVILSAFYMLKYATATNITSECKAWDCISGIGGSDSGTSRMCARISSDPNNTIFGVEGCQPSTFLCDANETLTSNVTCSNYTAWPWKNDMPAGDSCTTNEECYINLCNTTGSTKTCAGKEAGETCSDDRECYPGLYCANDGGSRNCTPVAKKDENCSNTKPCEFGYGCANGNCTRFGSLANGQKYYIQDDYLFPDPNALTNKMYFVCENFFAYDSGDVAEGKYPVLVCSDGPLKNFNTEERKVGDEMECNFTLTFDNGTNTTLTEYAS